MNVKVRMKWTQRYPRAVAAAVFASAAAVTFTTPPREMASATVQSEPPTIQPEELPGHLVYLSSDDCRAHEFDFKTATDAIIGTNAPCDKLSAEQALQSTLALSPNGRIIARRVTLAAGSPDYGRVGVFDLVTGKELWRSPQLHGRAPAGFYTDAPRFSYDSQQVAFCTYSAGKLAASVASATSGHAMQNVAGSCNVAFTRNGLAVIRGTQVILRRRVVFTGVLAAPNAAIATDPQGKNMGIITRPDSSHPARLELNVLRLDGREIKRYVGNAPGNIAPLQLAPNGKTALVTWEDTPAIAALTPSTNRLVLTAVLPGKYFMATPAFSPDGRFIAVERVQSTPRGLIPRRVAIVDSRRSKELFEVPIDAQAMVWLPN